MVRVIDLVFSLTIGTDFLTLYCEWYYSSVVKLYNRKFKSYRRSVHICFRNLLGWSVSDTSLAYVVYLPQQRVVLLLCVIGKYETKV